MERGRSRTEDKIDYRREAGTRTYVGGGEGGEGTKRRDKTDRNTGTIHRAWGGFLFEAPSATLECLANSIKRRHRPYPRTHRTRDSLISVAIISVMQRRATRNNKLLGKYNISLSIFLFDLHFEGNHLEDRYLFIDLYMCILFSKRSFLIFSRVYAYTRCSIHIVDI